MSDERVPNAVVELSMRARAVGWPEKVETQTRNGEYLVRNHLTDYRGNRYSVTYVNGGLRSVQCYDRNGTLIDRPSDLHGLDLILRQVEARYVTRSSRVDH